MKIIIPELSMVCLVGTTGSGKSSFARDNFLPTQVLSSDTFRGYVSDDENSQAATADAFDALHYMLGLRLRLGKMTVVDATNVQAGARKSLLRIASEWHALKVAIVIDTPESVCAERNSSRPNRQFPPHVLRNQRRDFVRAISELRKEGWHKIYFVQPEDDVEIENERSWSRLPEERGPFDIIGDVHGCYAELLELLDALGWMVEPELSHPEGRKLVFVGDLVDRGPDPVSVLKLAMAGLESKVVHWVPGNHDIKLARALAGRKVTLNHGLAETIAALNDTDEEFRKEVRHVIEGLVSHAVLDDEQLCVAHAGLPAIMQGRGSRAVRDFCLYGETTGEIDEFGLPVRYEWARQYRGERMVVYGHTPIPSPEWVNNTINIDTGCCFGGSLTALRYPERELVSVKAHQVYAEPARPIFVEKEDDPYLESTLEIQDVTGRMGIETELLGRITIREENSIAALEVMSRFAADPRWLIYLPPTMSPCATSHRPGFLEYPTEAFQYYREVGVEQVVCQEKHMGSRAVAVVCRNPEVARSRFGVEGEEIGVITTRTGRRFFEDLELEQALLRRIVFAADSAGLFKDLKSDWLLLDMELMPWSAKAIGLLRDQYAPVGAAALALAEVWMQVGQALEARGCEGGEELRKSGEDRCHSADQFIQAYQRYCWPVNSIDDYVLAPFHLMAAEGCVMADRSHLWHLEMLDKLCAADLVLFRQTQRRVVNVLDEAEVADACAWWESLVSTGGEGMVVKPLEFIQKFDGMPIQPGVKCRGPEYLRIIYGPEYLQPANLDRLRSRGLHRKRSMAIREFALGIEALTRFVNRAPLRRVHECVFGVLALESEPVDPRL